MDNGFWVQNTFATSIAFAIMFFDIFYMSTFFEKEGMNTIMFCCLATAIMNSATCDDDNICIFTDVEIVVDNVIKSTFRKDNRDMDTFVFCIFFDFCADVLYGSYLL